MSIEKIYQEGEIPPQAARLRKARAELRLTQQKLAGRLGWKASKIRDLELGKQRITMEIAMLIQQHFSINHHWLLTGEGRMMGPYVRDYILVNRLEGPPEPTQEAPTFYEVVEELPKKRAVTVVKEEEMQAIHQVLTVLRSGDPATISAIKGNLLMAVRLCKFLNPRFGDIIMLERRVKQIDIPFPDRRKAASME